MGDEGLQLDEAQPVDRAGGQDHGGSFPSGHRSRVPRRRVDHEEFGEVGAVGQAEDTDRVVQARELPHMRGARIQAAPDDPDGMTRNDPGESRGHDGPGHDGDRKARAGYQDDQERGQPDDDRGEGDGAAERRHGLRPRDGSLACDHRSG